MSPSKEPEVQNEQSGGDGIAWAELLVHSKAGESTTITLYLYTDLGLVPMKTPLRRDAPPPESCLDQRVDSGD